MKTIILCLGLLIASTALAGNVDQLCHPDASKFDSIFHESIKEKLPSATVKALLDDLAKKYGGCKGVSKLKGEKYSFDYATATVSSKVYFGSNGKITGLWFGAPVLKKDSWDNLKKDLSSLKGTVAFDVVGDGGSLFSYGTRKPLAVGSTFKLYIFKTLIEEIDKGKMYWRDTMKLKKELVSLPSGKLQEWPVGSPVTLHTLASLMISISDNTATDHLLSYLGRENVEKQTKLNRPLLSTLEMFKLSAAIPDKEAKKYLKLDEKAKRKYLGTLTKISSDKVNPGDLEPADLDLEWKATTDEICTLLFAMKGERILAINPGLAKKEDWSFVGFKGGSAPGVIQFSHLLQKKDGKWLCVSATQNHNAVVSEGEFAQLVTRAFALLK